MSMRGERAPGSRVVTSAVRGIFRTNAATRAEVLALIEAPQRLSRGPVAHVTGRRQSPSPGPQGSRRGAGRPRAYPGLAAPASTSWRRRPCSGWSGSAGSTSAPPTSSSRRCSPGAARWPPPARCTNCTAGAADCLIMGTLTQFERLLPKLKQQPFGLRRLAGAIETALRNYDERVPAGPPGLDLSRRPAAHGRAQRHSRLVLRRRQLRERRRGGAGGAGDGRGGRGPHRHRRRVDPPGLRPAARGRRDWPGCCRWSKRWPRRFPAAYRWTPTRPGWRRRRWRPAPT